MPTNQFFAKKGPFPLKEIIRNIRCNGDFSHANDFEIYGVESLSNATKNDMTFLNSSKYKNLSLKTKGCRLYHHILIFRNFSLIIVSNLM